MFFKKRKSADIAGQMFEMLQQRRYVEAISLGTASISRFANPKDEQLAKIMSYSGIAFFNVFKTEKPNAISLDIDPAKGRQPLRHVELDRARDALEYAFKIEQALGFSDPNTVYHLLLIYSLHEDWGKGYEIYGILKPSLRSLEPVALVVQLGKVAEHFDRSDELAEIWARANALDPTHWWVEARHYLLRLV